jgi:hypothetical protein
MRPQITLRHALADPNLLGGILTGDSWRAWHILLMAAMGERLTPEERVIFKQFTGRDREPGRPAEEMVVVKGRRAGGSYSMGTLASYIGGCCSHPSLVPGERGIILIVAADQRQATVILDYVTAIFEQSPILRQLIEQRTARTLRLTNSIDIEVRSADFRTLRGLTLIAAFGDEIAFFMTGDSSANPDTEILTAIRPGLATTRGPLFLISSPYARRGELWELYREHYGPNGDPLILVAQGASRDFNDTLPQSIVDRALARDFAAASAEYMGLFRTDIENFVSLERVMLNVSKGIMERPYDPSWVYNGFVDPSGGSADSMTLCIAHQDYGRKTVVIDALREVTPPFSPEQVTEDFSKLLHSYHVTTIQGDRYGGIWPVEQFGRFAILYEQSAAPKSDLYRDLLPLLNSCRIELLDHPKLIQQLTRLERRVARGGRDSIDHAPGGHDDIVNAAAGAAAKINEFGAYDTTGSWLDGPDKDNQGFDGRAWRAQQLASALTGMVTLANAPSHYGRWWR